LRNRRRRRRSCWRRGRCMRFRDILRRSKVRGSGVGHRMIRACALERISSRCRRQTLGRCQRGKLASSRLGRPRDSCSWLPLGVGLISAVVTLTTPGRIGWDRYLLKLPRLSPGRAPVRLGLFIVHCRPAVIESECLYGSMVDGGYFSRKPLLPQLMA
jgi:hypothetical protein